MSVFDSFLNEWMNDRLNYATHYAVNKATHITNNNALTKIANLKHLNDFMVVGMKMENSKRLPR